MRKDTIAAISTAMTNSGIGIVRISGEEAFDIIKKIYKGKKDKKVLTIHPYFVIIPYRQKRGGFPSFLS